MEIRYRPKLRNNPTEKCLVPILANVIIPGMKHGPSISTGIKIPLGDWNYSSESIKISKETKNQRDVFIQVQHNLNRLGEFSEGKSIDEVKAWVQSAIKAAKEGKVTPIVSIKEEQENFLYWFVNYKDYKFKYGYGKAIRKPLKESTRQKYLYFKKFIEAFEDEHGKIKISKLDEKFQSKYCDFVKKKYPTSWNSRDDMRKMYSQTLKHIREEGYGLLISKRAERFIVFLKDDFEYDPKEVEKIALKPQEVKWLMDLDLDDDAQRRTRDIYILNLELGQSIETLLRINPKNSEKYNGGIMYTGVREKNGKIVTPVAVEERNIKSFYKHFPWHKPVKTTNQVNSESTKQRRLLKEVARKAGLNRIIYTRKKRGKKHSIIKECKLYEVIEFHSGRRYANSEYSSIYDSLDTVQTFGWDKGSAVQEESYMLPKASIDNAKSRINKLKKQGSIIPK